MSKLLFLRGDVLGRIIDHDRAEHVAHKAIELAADDACACYTRARPADRFHRSEQMWFD